LVSQSISKGNWCK